MSSNLHHGGRLRAAAHHYRIPLQHWLDLSTGISPWGWPTPTIPADIWRCLPEDDDGLRMATLAYFNGINVLPIAGSQAAIQTLPRLLSPRRVGVLTPCYAEHERCWQDAGHVVTQFAYADCELAVESSDVLILTNPNNPTGRVIPADTLLQWHSHLVAHGGLLIVDEAFMDSTPAHSVMQHAHQSGLVVLRSLGKFFGLAGLRCGFLAAEAALLARAGEAIGPWSLSHPARWITQRALADRDWQALQKARLAQASERLSMLLTQSGFFAQAGCDLFRWVPCDNPDALHTALAQRGILVRCFQQGLRFGLPATEAHWDKLGSALKEMIP